jgi:hypothetical protein
MSEPEPGPLLRDLQQTMRRHMMTTMPLDPSGTMGELSFRSLHQFYAAWRGRVPVARSRRVHISPELLDNPGRAAYSLGLRRVLREIADGEDLRPRMSLLIDTAYTPYVPPCLARRRSQTRSPDVDRLLGDWGLHHLHLGTEPHPKRPSFVARSDHVLFVAFMPNDAYLVDLVRHESDGANWAALDILDTIVRNWPEAGIVHSSNYATGIVGGNWSDADRKDLRAAGVSTGVVEIEGRVWVAGLGGQGLTGIPSPVSQHCMMVSWHLSGYEPTEHVVRQQLTDMAIKHRVPDGWRAVVDGEDYGFWSGGVFVRFGSLLPPS